MKVQSMDEKNLKELLRNQKTPAHIHSVLLTIKGRLQQLVFEFHFFMARAVTVRGSNSTLVSNGLGQYPCQEGLLKLTSVCQGFCITAMRPGERKETLRCNSAPKAC